MVLSLLLVSCPGNRNKVEEISFSWWGKDARNKYTLEGIAQFESKNPTINVVPEYSSWEEYEASFGEKLKSGQCADVMQINFDWLYKYSENGNDFYDLNTLSEYIDFYNFTLVDLSFGTIDEKLVAIPIAFNTAIPVYDKRILSENNLSVPSNWDQLFEMAKVLKKKGMYVFTISKRHLFFLTMAWFEQTHSKKIFNEDGSLNINLEEIAVIYDFVEKMVNEGVVYAFNDGFQLNALSAGKVAGAVLWCNETSIFLSEVKNLGGKAILGNFITIPGAVESGWYLKPASMLAIKKDCKNPEAAAKFVNYLLNDREFALLQKNDKGVPISNSSLTALMEENQLESMQYNALMKIRFNSDAINKMFPIMEDNNLILAFADNVYDYIIGVKSKDEACKAFFEFLKS